MKQTIISIILLFSIFPVEICGQIVKYDSTEISATSTLESYLDEIGFYLDRYEADSMLLFAEKALQLADQYGHNEYKAEVYMLLSDMYRGREIYAASDSVLFLALNFANTPEQTIKTHLRLAYNSIDDGKTEEGNQRLEEVRTLIGNDTISEEMLDFYCIKSSYYERKEDQSSQLEFLFRARQLADHVKGSYDKGQILGQIVDLLLSRNAREQAKPYIEELLAIAIEENDYFLQQACLQKRARIYFESKQYAAAREECYQRLDLINSENIKRKKGNTHFLLGMTFIFEEKMDSAFYHLRLSKKMNEQDDNIDQLVLSHYALSRAFLKIKDYNQCILYGELAKQDYPYFLPELNNTLLEAYTIKQDYTAALAIATESNEQWMKIAEENQDGEILSMLLEDNFEKEIQNTKLELQVQKEVLLKEKAQNSIWQLVISGGIVLVAILIGIIFFNSEKNKKIDEQRRALEKSNTFKDKVFTVLAHDLRNPIGGLTSVLKFLERGDFSIQDFKGMIPDLQKNTSAIYETLNNLLYWAKMQMKGVPSTKKLVNVNERLQQVGAFFHQLMQQKNISYTTQLPPDLTLYIAPSHIDLLLRNIVANAIKFTPENGQIKVHARQEKSEVIFSISDTGIGIEAAQIPTLFTENISSTGTANEEGTGLGLKLCKEIIDLNNGSINMQSKIGVGTTFYFTLPKNA